MSVTVCEASADKNSGSDFCHMQFGLLRVHNITAMGFYVAAAEDGSEEEHDHDNDSQLAPFAAFDALAEMAQFMASKQGTGPKGGKKCGSGVTGCACKAVPTHTAVQHCAQTNKQGIVAQATAALQAAAGEAQEIEGPGGQETQQHAAEGQESGPGTRSHAVRSQVAGYFATGGGCTERAALCQVSTAAVSVCHKGRPSHDSERLGLVGELLSTNIIGFWW